MKQGRGSKNIKLPKLRIQLRLFLYGITVVLGIVSLTEAVNPQWYYAIDIAVFVLAACGVTVSCYYLVHDLTYGIKKKVRPMIENHSFTNRIYKDYRYRTVSATRLSFLLNLFYAISNGIYGFVNHSAWLGSFSAYYMFLSVMRFRVLWYEGKSAKTGSDSQLRLSEWKLQYHCGILLILITIALSGAVILLVNEEGGKRYSGTLIFAAAAYTFYKITVSILNMVKAAKLKSPLLITIRNIGYADAMVSLLSLQTAMFLSFGEKNGLNAQRMNGITGTAVCMVVLAIGIYLMRSAHKKIAAGAVLL